MLDLIQYNCKKGSIKTQEPIETKLINFSQLKKKSKICNNEKRKVRWVRSQWFKSSRKEFLLLLIFVLIIITVIPQKIIEYHSSKISLYTINFVKL